MATSHATAWLPSPKSSTAPSGVGGSHSGWARIWGSGWADFVTVFGMGVDLATFLTVYAAVMSGDIVSVSIGAKPGTEGLIGGIVKGLGSGLGLIGEPQGLDNSHNRFEADVSPTRGDLYKT